MSGKPTPVTERRYLLLEEADSIVREMNKLPLIGNHFRSVEVIENAEALSENLTTFGLPVENRARTHALLNRLQGLTLTLTLTEKRLAPYLDRIRVPEWCEDLRRLLLAPLPSEEKAS